jgi:hypothetical protein
MKKNLFTLIFLTSGLLLSAQDFVVPKNFSATKPEDYSKYENDIIQCINWIMTVPVNEQADKRKEAYAFL